MNTQRIIRLLSIVLALSLASCSPRFAVNTDQDSQINLSAYRSFKIIASDNQGENPILNSPLNRNRLSNFIIGELTSRGYTLDNSQADLGVRFYTLLQNKQDIRSYNNNNFGFFWWFNNQPNQTFTRNYEEGTLIVDILDNSTGQLIWQGWAIGEIDYTKDKYKEKLAQKIEQIFESFPSSTARSRDTARVLP